MMMMMIVVDVRSNVRNAVFGQPDPPPACRDKLCHRPSRHRVMWSQSELRVTTQPQQPAYVWLWTVTRPVQPTGLWYWAIDVTGQNCL